MSAELTLLGRALEEACREEWLTLCALRRAARLEPNRTLRFGIGSAAHACRRQLVALLEIRRRGKRVARRARVNGGIV